MLETRRQAYLNALGIDSWFPRHIIEGAKASPIQTSPIQTVEEIGLPVEGETESKTVESEISQFKKIQPQTSQPQTSQPAINQPNSGTQAQVAQSVMTPEFKPKTSAQKMLRFALQCELIAGQYLLVADLKDPFAPDYSSQEYRLRKDILFALGLNSADIEKFQFSWPLVNNTQLNRSREDAVQALTGMLHARLGAQRQLSQVILLGQCASEIALNRCDFFEDMLKETAPAANTNNPFIGSNVLVSHSLNELLIQPALKKHLMWRISHLIHIIPPGGEQG